MKKILLAVGLASLAAPALSHTGIGAAHGFGYGFAHPFGGLDHVLAMAAVGLWAAMLGGRALWAVPVAFVLAMTVGAGLAMSGLALPMIEPGILLSIVIFGAAVALARPVPLGAACGTVALFAVFHGAAHGGETPAGAGGFDYVAGFVSATALLHALGVASAIAVARVFGGGAGRIVVRTTGAATAFGGVLIAAM